MHWRLPRPGESAWAAYAEYQREAAERAESLRSVFAELSGLSARKAAEELNRRGITTAEGVCPAGNPGSREVGIIRGANVLHRGG
jgi:hypothetical protein